MEKNQFTKSHEDLVCGYLKGELTNEEIGELTKWISLDKANKRYFDECSELWVTAKSVSGNPGFNAQEGFWKFRQKTGIVDNSSDTGLENKTINFRTLLRYAAVFISAFTIGGALFYQLDIKHDVSVAQSVNEIVVPLGSKAVFNLSDGTIVTLNAGSTLRIDPSFGNNDRILELEGEGYFQVAKDENKPFIVKTPYLNVIALGTEFNIKAYSDDKTIETTLVSGSVKIEPASSDSKGEITILKPSEKLTYFKEDSHIVQESTTDSERRTNDIRPARVISETASTKLVKENVNIEPVVSWKEDRWIFEQESLSRIAVDLERKYNVKIVFESEKLKNYRFTGIILAEPIEQVLEVMSITAPIGFRLKGNVVTLTENRDFIEVNKELYNTKHD